MYETVFFDFNDTLVRSQSIEHWVRAVGEAGWDGPVPDSLAWSLGNVWAETQRRSPGLDWDLSADLHRSAFTDTLVSVGIDPDLTEILYGVMPGQWVAFDDTLDALGELREAGKTLCLISNIGVDIRPRLAELGIGQLLDGVVLSFEEEVTKPDPEIFRRALDAVGAEPASSLMVGDSWRHDGGAAALGIRTLVLGPSRGTVRGLADAVRLAVGPESR